MYGLMKSINFDIRITVVDNDLYFAKERFGERASLQYLVHRQECLPGTVMIIALRSIKTRNADG